MKVASACQPSVLCKTTPARSFFSSKMGQFGSNQTASVFDGKAYLRPLVKPHPVTGRKMLGSPARTAGGSSVV